MASAPRVQARTISHTGGELGTGYVTRSQNQTAPQAESEVLSFECPKQFESIRYRGRRDATRFVPRTMQTVTGTANDDTVVSLNNNIQPIHGETEMSEQDYPVAFAYNVTQAAEVEITAVDYSANEVTLGTDPADGDEVKVYPILAEGELRYEGFNQFDQSEGVLYPWSMPLYTFHDFRQDQRGRQVHQHGSIKWGRYERLVVTLDSPHKIVWEDDHYPDGEYVSTFEQDVRIEL